MLSAACRVTLRDENRRLVASVLLRIRLERVVVVDVAVAELFIVKAHFLRLFAGHLRYSGH